MITERTVKVGEQHFLECVDDSTGVRIKQVSLDEAEYKSEMVRILTEGHMEKNQGVTYSEALLAVSKEYPDLFNLNKTKDFEERRETLRADLRKQEERVAKAESKKRASLEKFAIKEATQEEINKVKRECLEAMQERDDTRELIAFLEDSVKKQIDVAAQLPQKIHAAKIAVWDKIAEILQGQLEIAIGDRAKLLWVAMLNTGHHTRPMEPQYLPERLRVIATPHRDEITVLGNNLWNEFVGAD